MKIEPPIGASGRALLRSIRIFCNRYPIEKEPDRRVISDMGGRGYLQKHGPNRSLLSLTAKGEAFLDRLMRCE